MFPRLFVPATVAALAALPASAATIDVSARYALSLIGITGPDPAADIDFFQDAWPGSDLVLQGAATGTADAAISGYGTFPTTPMVVTGATSLDVTQSATGPSSGFALTNNTLILDVINLSATSAYDFVFAWDWSVDLSGAGFPASGVTGSVSGSFDDPCNAATPSVSFSYTQSSAPFSASYGGTCTVRFTLGPNTGPFPEAMVFQPGFLIGSQIDAEQLAPVPLPAAGTSLLGGMIGLGMVAGLRRRRRA